MIATLSIGAHMPFRFRRRVTLFPGVRVNLSKRGASLSVGGRGATMNLSRQGKRVSVGIPGSGISYSEFEPSNQVVAGAQSRPAGGNAGRFWVWPTAAILIVSAVAAFWLRG